MADTMATPSVLAEPMHTESYQKPSGGLDDESAVPEHLRMSVLTAGADSVHMMAKFEQMSNEDLSDEEKAPSNITNAMLTMYESSYQVVKLMHTEVI